MAEQIVTYIALREFTVGDRVVKKGEPVREAETWKRPDNWIKRGYIAVSFREADELDDIAADAAVPVSGAAALAAIGVKDLRKLAKDAGFKGYSKLKRDALVELLVESESSESQVLADA